MRSSSSGRAVTAVRPVARKRYITSSQNPGTDRGMAEVVYAGGCHLSDCAELGVAQGNLDDAGPLAFEDWLADFLELVLELRKVMGIPELRTRSSSAW
jgi:hypothetical protein